MPDLTEGQRWTHDDYVRLIGVRDGYVHTIVKLKRAIAHGTEYPPIDPRHTRKIKAQEDRLRIPREVLGQLEAELAGIRDAMTAARAALRAKGGEHGDA